MELKERLEISTKLLSFLERRDDIHFRTIERELGMPKSSLKVTDGMLPKKWTEPVAIYIRDKHGFDAWGNEDPVHVAQLTIEALETLDPSIGDHEKKRKWGNYKPTFNDGGYRFRDVYEVKGEDNLQNNGLWKRYDDWAFIGTDKSKTRRIKSGWEGTGELHVDTTGEYTLLENGVKLYRFPKV